MRPATVNNRDKPTAAAKRPKNTAAAKRPKPTAWEKCERLLAYRERSSGELRKRLTQEGYDTQTIESMIDKLVSSGLVDDERFGRLFIESKLNQGWGMQRIAYALKSHDITLDDYPELFAAFSDEDDELDRARTALERYRGRSKDEYNGRYHFLVTKGFSASVIHQVMLEWRAG